MEDAGRLVEILAVLEPRLRPSRPDVEDLEPNELEEGELLGKG